MAEHFERIDHMLRLRDRLENRILSEIPGTYLNGGGTPRIPNTSNIGFDGRDSETLVNLLDQYEICVSSGSACLSNSVTPSHVIQAMTGSHKKASEAVRFSLSHLNSNADVDFLLKCLKMILKRIG
jgi:cysteine desulfurase